MFENEHLAFENEQTRKRFHAILNLQKSITLKL